MARYTIEDIEILRKKSGVTYEEAVNLLEYHNGSLARALIDLEKNGRMKPDGASAEKQKGFKGVLDTLYRTRLKISKKDVTIANLSVLFLLLVALISWPLLLIGLGLSVLLGYRIRVDRNSSEFSSESFDDLVSNAKSNVQSTVSSFSKQFGQQGEKAEDGAEATAQPDGEPPRQPRAEAPASGTKPVNVQFPGGGSVDVREDEDGYHEADIQ